MGKFRLGDAETFNRQLKGFGFVPVNHETMYAQPCAIVKYHILFVGNFMVRAEKKQDHRAKRRAEIAQWLRSTMAEKGLQSTNWSLDAGLTRATISRALNPKSKTILSPATLMQLAACAGVPAPFEITLPGKVLEPIPSVEVFCRIIDVALKRLDPERAWTPKQVWPFAAALRYTLLELQSDPRAAADLEIVERMARTSLRTLQE